MYVYRREGLEKITPLFQYDLLQKLMVSNRSYPQDDTCPEEWVQNYEAPIKEKKPGSYTCLSLCQVISQLL